MTHNQAPTIAEGVVPTPPQKDAGVLQPYPEYKDSELPWLGKIPKYWEENRAKYYFREVDERSKTGDEELLSVSHMTGVTPRSQKNITMFKAESYTGYKLCKPHDLVINTMWAWMGALGVSKYSGIVSSGYGVYRPLHDQELVPEYMDSLLRTHPYTSEYYRRSTGIRSSRFRLYPEQFLRMPLVCPPYDEQEKIVSFLQMKEIQIKRYIHTKRRQIDVLNEQKRAIINNVVTCGIDPNVPFRLSGIEWLGDVPEHWKIVRLKNIASVVLGKMLTPSPSNPNDRLKPYLRSANIQWFKPKMDDVYEMWFSQKEMKNLRVIQGDVLINEGGDVGRACLWNDEIKECYIQNSVHKVTPYYNMRPIFLFFQFFLMGKRGYLESIVNRVSIGHLTREKLVSVPVVLPPIEEQDSIIKIIEEESTPIDNLIQQSLREIDLIREYRTRLINDVVTGKVDVRNIEIQEEIPVDVDEIEDLNELNDDEEYNNDNDTDDAEEGEE